MNEITEDVLYSLIYFMSFWDVFNLFKTCSRFYFFGKSERAQNYLTKKYFREVAPNKKDLFNWVSDLLHLKHKEYLRTLLGRTLTFSEFDASKNKYNPIISVGPFTKCKHVILLLCLIRHFKPNEISINAELSLPDYEVIDQKKEKMCFFSTLLSVIDHLSIDYTWSNPISNGNLIKIIITGVSTYSKIGKTIEQFLSS